MSKKVLTYCPACGTVYYVYYSQCIVDTGCRPCCKNDECAGRYLDKIPEEV